MSHQAMVDIDQDGAEASTVNQLLRELLRLPTYGCEAEEEAIFRSLRVAIKSSSTKSPITEQALS